jgi:hypothetical protein
MTRLLLGLAALALLGACGVQGDLERPNPLWGGQRAISVECRRERAHHETLDSRCKTPANAGAATPAAPTAAAAPVSPPVSPTAPDTGATASPATTSP